MFLVLCNAPPNEADRIAEQLVGERLAACVNLSPVRSVYRWQGEIQHDVEVTLWIKVSATGVDALRERLVALHPYELPEVLAFGIDEQHSLAAYVAWVEQECAPP